MENDYQQSLAWVGNSKWPGLARVQWKLEVEGRAGNEVE